MATTNIKTTAIVTPPPVSPTAPKRSKMPKSRSGTDMMKSVK